MNEKIRSLCPWPKCVEMTLENLNHCYYAYALFVIVGLKLPNLSRRTFAISPFAWGLTSLHPIESSLVSQRSVSLLKWFSGWKLNNLSDDWYHCMSIKHDCHCTNQSCWMGIHSEIFHRAHSHKTGQKLPLSSLKGPNRGWNRRCSTTSGGLQRRSGMIAQVERLRVRILLQEKFLMAESPMKMSHETFCNSRILRVRAIYKRCLGCQLQ